MVTNRSFSIFILKIFIFKTFKQFIFDNIGAVIQPASMVAGRIVGGNPGEIKEIPYLVSVLYDEVLIGDFRHICGGTIISINAILTAANCTDG